MREPRIYDSQGIPLDAEGPEQVNERIKSFFFAGVRFALSRSGGNFEVICFFRGRDSEVSRANQYYAVLESSNLGDLQNLQETISRYVSEEYDISVDTTTGDDRFFEIFGRSPQHPPGTGSTRQDIIDVVENGNKAALGVGSHEDAYALFRELVGEVKTRKFVVADNASHSSISDYTVAIEIGDSSGLELLGDTEETIEQMKERRRRQSQLHAGGGDRYGNASPNSSPTKKLFLIAGIGGIGILLLSSYGLCIVGGVSFPFVGDLPGATCGPGHTVTIETYSWEDSGYSITGTLKVNDRTVVTTNTSEIRMKLLANDETVFTKTRNETIQNGQFEAHIAMDNGSVEREELTDLVVEWYRATDSVNITSIGDQNQTASPDSTPPLNDTQTQSSTPNRPQNATIAKTPATNSSVGSPEG